MDNKLAFYKLQMDVILEKLSDFAIIPKTKKLIDNLKPSSDILGIKEELDHTDECLRILYRVERAPICISSDYDKILKLASRDAIIPAIDLYETVKLFQTVKACEKHLANLQKEQIECEFYASLVEGLIVLEYLESKLVKSIDENGYVLDEASPTLKSIRRKIAQIDASIKHKLQEIIAKEGAKLSQTSVVLRDNRYCLAVRSEYKNQIKGVVLDTSASQQTCFIEPLIVGQLMSDKNRLYEEEKEEINKIIKELSLMISENVEILDVNFQNICKIDYVFAKAMLAMSYDGNKPNINDNARLNLVNARHPLLKVKKVIPNNVSFGKDYLGIIVTGPNTGGKTVLLKTVGLLCMMVKYGLLIPADETSDVMIFDQIFCDIGDDQSIESNLSTFSSHMNNITNIINNVSKKSLVLFDEIGSGTDPVEGTNLAKAILKYLINNEVSFITTTHYSELKAFAFENPLIINASMEFDQNTLSPTYKLNLGVTGSSNAFNIARKLGLKKEIIEDAKMMASTKNDDSRRLILKLEKQSKELEDIKKEYLAKTIEADNIKREFTKKSEILDKEKNKILKKAQEEADEFVDKVSKEALDILEKAHDIKKNDAKLHQIIEAKHQVNSINTTIKKEKKPKKINNITLDVGVDVYIPSYDQYGIIDKKLNNGSYVVSVGNMTLTLKANQLESVEKQVEVQKSQSNIGYSVSKARISLTLDLRGKRYEEAKDLLDKYIDDLIVAGIKQANIIHGFGTGVIRELVRNYLKNNKNVDSYRYGGENEGGLGVTVVVLK